MEHFFKHFKLDHEKEKIETITTNINNGVAFRGTNLWILIFAIFVASLGLNVNSTAVIIGAMLISPLMGPIMGIGLGVGISDLLLVRKAFLNYFLATVVALITSTIFFLLSPLDDAHSEILARTSPNIYDVLIALFGGFAGIIATSSRQKGNVIPGVAIATALMPPLCTAGYGLATFQFKYFFGAFYLYIINTVFIALATLLIVRLLHFPYKQLQNSRAEKLAKRLVGIVVIVTLLPSLYFGYDLVQQNKFTKEANRFITNEAHFTNDYLLNKKIDSKSKNILLVYGGNEIKQQDIDIVKKQMTKYQLKNATLEIKQGFAYLNENEPDKMKPGFNQLSAALEESAKQELVRKNQLDSITKERKFSLQLYAELKAQHPTIETAVLQPSFVVSDSASIDQTYLVVLTFNRQLSKREKAQLNEWLKVRLSTNRLTIVIQ
ncbi:MAG: TIGR00341 family protein [Bacteroidota bacterium]